MSAAARALIVVPAFNEERAIGAVIAEIREAGIDFPVVVIDDCSVDGTAEAARQAGAQVLPLPHHLGLGGAVQAGYRLAFELGYDFVIRIDGDGQHDPRDIPKIYEALRTSGCQMAIGSRFANGEGEHSSLVRGIGIRFFRLMLRPILGRTVHDPTSGFVGVNREALAVFSHSFPLEYPEIEALVVLQRKRFGFIEVPCRMRPRMAGKSTITPVKSLYYILRVFLGVFVNVLKYDRKYRRR